MGIHIHVYKASCHDMRTLWQLYAEVPVVRNCVLLLTANAHLSLAAILERQPSWRGIHLGTRSLTSSQNFG